MSLTAGQKLGPYEILEPIGAGGMGEVYKARDNRLNRTVAVKILNIHIANNPDLKARFDREAKAISSLNHPNICTLYDIGSDEGQDYLVMEYIEGESLNDRIKKGALPMTELLDIAIQIADALDNAHRQGLIHRDLKPGNIMLTKDGAKLLDFGLAKLHVDGEQPGVQSVTQTTPLTGAGTLIGTMQYMSPEQLEGKDADKRSDIFSFGAILYEMATGARPFAGNSQASLIASIMKEVPRSVSEVLPAIPPMLEQTVSQCLEKDPDQRWQSAGDLKRALKWIADGKVAPKTGLIPSNRSVRENIIFAGLILFILATAYLTYTHFFGPAEERFTTRSYINAPPQTIVQSSGGGHLSVSPDGTRLAFVAEDSLTGQTMLWVRPLNSLAAISLSGTENAIYPFWSFDGKHIGFFADGKLKKVPSIGGPVLTLCDVQENARGGSWNKDNLIIYAPGINHPIYKVSGAGGEPVEVTTMDSTLPENSQRFPVFLPDGNHFLFFSRTVSGTGGEKDAICIASLDDPSVTRLFLAKSNAMYSNGYIFYTRESFLMAQPFDVSSYELNGDPFPVAENVIFASGYNKGTFTVSGTGPLIYGEGIAPDGTIITTRNRSGKILDSILTTEQYNSSSNAPDESKFVFNIYDNQTENSELWIYDYNRDIKTRFTFDSSREVAPLWTEDGENIIFSSNRINARFDLFIKNADGVQPESLLYSDTTANMWATDISNDSRYLIINRFDLRTSLNGVWQLDLQTGEVTPLIVTAFDNYIGRLSPDNRWLAYGSNESGKEEVYITKYPEMTGKWQVSNDQGDIPYWSYTSDELYYLDRSDNICAVEIDGRGNSPRIGRVEKLFTINSFRPGLVYEPFRDDQRFLVIEAPGSAKNNQIIMVQNWLAEIGKQ